MATSQWPNRLPNVERDRHALDEAVLRPNKGRVGPKCGLVEMFAVTTMEVENASTTCNETRATTAVSRVKDEQAADNR